MTNKKTALNSHGVNALIKYHILSDEKMEEIGFAKNYYQGTDHEEYAPYWHFIKGIKFPNKYKGLDISFIVKIPKDNSDVNIMIIDEDFCQHYDYQRILNNNPQHEVANIVREQVEKWMKYLQDNGVLSGHKPNDYI